MLAKPPVQTCIIQKEDSFEQRYKILGQIGEGSYSKVLKCRDRKSGKDFACKRLNHQYSNWARVNGIPEINTLRRMPQHQNLLQIIEIHFDPRAGRVSLIFEIMDMNLLELINSRKKLLPEERARYMMFQLIRGLRHLHKHGIFHRDIKPENILLKRNPNTDEEVLKVADLGSVKGLLVHPPYTEYVSTRWYRSPECLLTSGYYGVKMDMWAVGCVFYELLTLRPLFTGSTELDQIDKIHQLLGPPPRKCLDNFCQLMRKNNVNLSVKPQKLSRVEGIQDMLCELGNCLSDNGDSDCYVTENYEPINPLNNILPPHLSKGVRDLLAQLLQYDADLRITANQAINHEYFSDLKEAAKLVLNKGDQVGSQIIQQPKVSVPVADINRNRSTMNIAAPQITTKKLSSQRITYISTNVSNNSSNLSSATSLNKKEAKGKSSASEGNLGAHTQVKYLVNNRTGTGLSNSMTVLKNTYNTKNPTKAIKESTTNSKQYKMLNKGGSQANLDLRTQIQMQTSLHNIIPNARKYSENIRSNRNKSKQRNLNYPEDKSSFELKPKIHSSNPAINKTSFSRLKTSDQNIKANSSTRSSSGIISAPSEKLPTKIRNNQPSKSKIPVLQKSLISLQAKAKPSNNNLNNVKPQKLTKVKTPPTFEDDTDDQPWEVVDDMTNYKDFSESNSSTTSRSFELSRRRSYYPSDVYVSSDEETAANILRRCDKLIEQKATLYRSLKDVNFI